MKSIGTILAAAFLLMPWCITPLFSQQNNGNKKVVITKRSVDAEGSEVTETIIKKGKAAENFNVEEYLKANDAEDVNINVDVVEENNRQRVIVRGNGVHTTVKTSSCGDEGAFLGVDEDSDEDEDEPGIVVQIVHGSAAEKAGLHSNDLITSLDGLQVSQWSELSRIINSKKPGEKLAIVYERNGKSATTEAMLTRRSEVECTTQPRGFLGVSDEDDDEDEDGVAVSITANSAAQKAGLEDGDIIFSLNETPIIDFEDISDFMDATKPGDPVHITYERDGQRNTTDATLGEQKSWDWKAWSNSSPSDELNKNWNWDNYDVTVREKEACLGVYTNAGTQDDERGALISSFTDESAAQEAEMAKGDLILSVNGQRVLGHDQLWNEIAKYKPNERVQVAYLRDGETIQVQTTLKACRDNSSRVEIMETDEEGDQKSREFTLWNWGNLEQKRMKERRVITIHKGEGDTPEKTPEAAAPASRDRNLKLDSFRAFPNPSGGPLTIEFKGAPVATTLSMFDASGRQLFREEMNAFSGDYSQQFDLTEYAKGTIVVQVQQGDKLFSEQIIVN